MAKATAKLTEQQILKEANFLSGWAKAKEIKKLGGETTFHTSGKFMTKIDDEMSAALFAAEFVVGTKWKFKVDRKKVAAAVKAYEAKTGKAIYAI